MKKSNILMTIFSVIFVLLTFYGFYLTIQNMGKDVTMLIIAITMLAVGLIGMIAIVVIFYKKKKNAEGKEKNEQEQ